jgi:hypothetical protein
MAPDFILRAGDKARKISETDLVEADIILTANDKAPSVVIREATCSPFAHSMNNIGKGQIVDSVLDGVNLRILSQALPNEKIAVAFRMPGITADQRLAIVRFLLAACLSNQGYDWGGAISSSGANLGTNDPGKFFCSELSLAAYQSQGLLLGNPPDKSPPRYLLDLYYDQQLDYVGHLVL